MKTFARWSAALGVAVTLGLWVVYAFAGAGAWWAELLRYLPFPLYLAPPLLALAASTALGRGWRAAGVLALALVAVDVMGLSWGRADAGSGAIRLMTLNAKSFGPNWAEHDRRVAVEIAEHDPDVLVLQDAVAYGDPAKPLPAPLKAVLGDRTLFQHGQYLVASRLPMRDCRPAAMAADVEGGEYVRCTITAASTDIDLVTVHLVSPRAGLNAARREGVDGFDDWRDNYRQRLAQTRILQRDLAGGPRPLILAGDLNAAEASPVVQALKSIGLRDAFSSAGFGYGYTHGHSLRTRFSFLRIDHVLVGATIGVRDCFVGGRRASEHRPVIADLVVRRE